MKRIFTFVKLCKLNTSKLNIKLLVVVFYFFYRKNNHFITQIVVFEIPSPSENFRDFFRLWLFPLQGIRANIQYKYRLVLLFLGDKSGLPTKFDSSKICCATCFSEICLRIRGTVACFAALEEEKNENYCDQFVGYFAVKLYFHVI